MYFKDNPESPERLLDWTAAFPSHWNSLITHLSLGEPVCSLVQSLVTFDADKESR